MLINKQRHTTTCGPVAVMNIIKLMGGRICQGYVDMFKGLGFDKKYGTTSDGMESMLDFFNIKYSKLQGHKTLLNKIIKELDNGKSVILLHHGFDDEYKFYGHYIVLTGHKKSSMIGLNWMAKSHARKEVLQKWILRCGGEAWVV